LGLQLKHTAGGGVTRRSAAADFQSDSQYLVTPCRWAASTWACNTHRRSDSVPTPTFGPIDWQAADTDRYFLKMIQHHLHRALTLLDRVMLGHNRHPSHRRKRHQTWDASLTVFRP
jgi:hypothetical protein